MPTDYSTLYVHEDTKRQVHAVAYTHHLDNTAALRVMLNRWDRAEPRLREAAGKLAAEYRQRQARAASGHRISVKLDVLERLRDEVPGDTDDLRVLALLRLWEQTLKADRMNAIERPLPPGSPSSAAEVYSETEEVAA